MSEHARRIVMIGTSQQTQGGVSSVVNVLLEGGLFDRCPVDYIATHCDGGAAAKLGVLLRAWPHFAYRLLRGRIALLHVHTASRASFWRKCLFMIPAILSGVPVVLHLHGAEFQIFYEKECSRLSRWLVRWVFEHVRAVVVLSQSWQRWVQANFSAARVDVVFNPIAVPARLEQGPSMRSPTTLLFLGRLGRRKGVYDLLQAVSRLAVHYPNLLALLGGDGELERVRDEARALRIEQHVKLPGWVGGEEKERLLDEAAIYVLPSYNEGLPMGVLEAMAHGLPIVTTPVGGISEAVSDGVEGYLVEPGDVDALADRIDRLLGDTSLRARMGAAARYRAERDFAVDGIVRQWVELYRELGVACDA